VALSNLATLYFDMGEIGYALDQWREVAALRRAQGDGAGEARTLSFTGQALAASGDPAAALEVYRRALPLHREAGDRRGEADTLNGMGAAYAALGDSDRALASFEAALALAREIEERRIEAYALQGIGGIGEHRGDPAAALELHRQALAIRRAVGHRGDQADSLARIADLQRRGGDLEAARATIEQALELIEELRTEVVRDDLRQSFFASRRDYYDFYLGVLLDLHRASPDAGWDAEALAAAERARARGLLDLLGEGLGGLRQGVDAELLAEEREAAEKLSAAERRSVAVLSGGHDAAAAEQADTAVAAALRAYRDVRGRLRAVSPRYTALTQP
jgi:tetratricopeptide (TPR) repeat protein